MGLTTSYYEELSEKSECKIWPLNELIFFCGKWQFWMETQIFNLLPFRRKLECILFWSAENESEIRKILNYLKKAWQTPTNFENFTLDTKSALKKWMYTNFHGNQSKLSTHTKLTFSKKCNYNPHNLRVWDPSNSKVPWNETSLLDHKILWLTD